jgi:hypothetical protein
MFDTMKSIFHIALTPLLITTVLVLALVGAAAQILIVTTNAQNVTGGVATAQNQTETSDQVAFHTLGGVPFTVTYTVDAEAKDLTS